MPPPQQRRAHDIDFAAILDALAKTPPTAFHRAWGLLREN
jgi:hypothetical protein